MRGRSSTHAAVSKPRSKPLQLTLCGLFANVVELAFFDIQQENLYHGLVVWFSVPDKKLKRILDEVIWHRRHLENREKMTELIRDLHDARGLSDLRALQQRLLEAVLAAEAEQRTAQAKKEAAGSAIGTIEQKRGRGRLADEDEARLLELRHELEERRLEVEVLQRVRRQLRGVGDGLLWKAVDFNRVYVYAVSDAPGAGNAFLSGPEGLAAELETVESLWRNKGALAVMHDLTNCGRIGDLTIVAPGETFKVAEVKASGSLDPKQMRRMKDMVRFLKGAEKPVDGGYTARVVAPDDASPHEPERWESNNWEPYVRALVDAGNNGLGWATVGDYLGVVAVSVLHPMREEMRAKSSSDGEFERLRDEAWKPAYEALGETIVTREQDVVVFWDSSEKYEEGLLGAPFSIYPLPPEFCAALECDYVKMMVHENVTNFCGGLSGEGFDVTAAPSLAGKKRSDQTFHHVYLSRPGSASDGGKGSPRIHLGKPLMQQVLGEAMSVETVAAAARSQMAVMAEGQEVSLLLVNGDGGRVVSALPASGAATQGPDPTVEFWDP